MASSGPSLEPFLKRRLDLRGARVRLQLPVGAGGLSHLPDNLLILVVVPCIHLPRGFKAERSQPHHVMAVFSSATHLR